MGFLYRQSVLQLIFSDTRPGAAAAACIKIDLAMSFCVCVVARFSISPQSVFLTKYFLA